MSISAVFGTKLILKPNSSSSYSSSLSTAPKGGAAAVIIECSSRPQKKATAHHMKTRPKKTQPWDVKRGPAVYAPLPPLPPDWSFVASEATESSAEAQSPAVDNSDQV